MTKAWGTIAIACAFVFVVLQQVANKSVGPPHRLFGILAGACVIIAGIGVAAQRSHDVYYGNELLDKLPPWMQKLIPAYYIRRLFRSRQAYARFNFIAAGLLFILMGIAFTFLAITR